jgi:hypothetical protein
LFAAASLMTQLKSTHMNRKCILLLAMILPVFSTVKSQQQQVGNSMVGDMGHGFYWAGLSHVWSANQNGYAILQNNNGAYTLINKANTGDGYIGFRVANQDKAVITNAGNMGIGTTAPQQRLEVAGGHIRINSVNAMLEAVPGQSLIIRQSGQGNMHFDGQNYLFFRDANAKNKLFFNFTNGQMVMGGTTLAYGQSNMLFQIANTTAFSNTNYSGTGAASIENAFGTGLVINNQFNNNTGTGLDITSGNAGQYAIRAFGKIQLSSFMNNGNRFLMVDNNGDVSAVNATPASNSFNEIYVGPPGSGGNSSVAPYRIRSAAGLFQIQRNNGTNNGTDGYYQNSLEIKQDNSVWVNGAGKSANQLALVVLGKISGNEVALCLDKTNCFPDYVFDEKYPLLPVAELEKYIAVNKHLPNIPSAKEVEAVGSVNAKEMLLKLLEKVEELSLYTIDLHKKTEALSKENAALENK